MPLYDLKKRHARIKVLFFTSSAKMTQDETELLRLCKEALKRKYDEAIIDLSVTVLNSAVPQHFEKCDYVCGYNIPFVFKECKVLDVKSVNKTTISIKKKDSVTNVD